MKKVVFIFLLVSILLSFVFPVFASEYELRLAVTATPPHPWIDAANYMIEEIAKRTEGKVNVTLYHSSSLGTSQAILDEISMGTIDFGLEGMMVLSSMVPEAVVLSYPYFFRDYDQFRKVTGRDSNVLAYFQKLFQDRNLGIRLLALGGGGTRQYSNRIKPIRTPDDLKGMKMRVPGSPIESKIWGRAGAITTPTSWGEVYSAIQTGVVDAFESTISGYYGSKLYEVAKYHSKTQHQYMISGVFISEATYNKLPPSYREIVAAVGAEAGAVVTEKGLEYDERLLQEMIDKKLAVVNEVDKDAFIELYAPLQDELAKSSGFTTLLDLMREVRDR